MTCPFLDVDNLLCKALAQQQRVGSMRDGSVSYKDRKPGYIKLTASEAKKCKKLWRDCPIYQQRQKHKKNRERRFGEFLDANEKVGPYFIEIVQVHQDGPFYRFRLREENCGDDYRDGLIAGFKAFYSKAVDPQPQNPAKEEEQPEEPFINDAGDHGPVSLSVRPSGFTFTPSAGNGYTRLYWRDIWVLMRAILGYPIYSKEIVPEKSRRLARHILRKLSRMDLLMPVGGRRGGSRLGGGRWYKLNGVNEEDGLSLYLNFLIKEHFPDGGAPNDRAYVLVPNIFLNFITYSTTLVIHQDHSHKELAEAPSVIGETPALKTTTGIETPGRDKPKGQPSFPPRLPYQLRPAESLKRNKAESRYLRDEGRTSEVFAETRRGERGRQLDGHPISP